MSTVADLITESLQRIGVLAASETATSGDMTLCFNVLNQLISGWQTERLTIYSPVRTTWTITSGNPTYTIGVGSTDINVARPVFIDRVNFIDTSQTPDLELPLRMLTDTEYDLIPLKDLTSVLPSVVYYNPTYPLGTLTLYPTPTSSTLSGAIYIPTAVPQFTATSDVVSLPPGYQRFIVTNLAVEVAPLFGAQPNKLLAEAASESKADVKRANIRPYDLFIESAALVQNDSAYGYNIYQS